ncbi:MAG: VPLPA-CTERM sorting domain-containing protein [Planctomycetales bacterium]|nr:VPLPA-CTERM sorting domain-containing protein [Planctomycetales bacterium]
MKTLRIVALLLPLLGSSPALCAHTTLYDSGVSPAAAADTSLHFGTHLLTTDAAHPTVLGAFGGISFAGGGDALEGDFVQSYDSIAITTDLSDGVANRGDDAFSMLIWDMGAAYDALRLYPRQDHYEGGAITDPNIAQDVMEYSVWGSTDGDSFVLLSDTVAFDVNGAGAGEPSYTFNGVEPTVVYRGGSSEQGLLNAYVREYVFDSAYQYYGIRSSTVSLEAADADPEVDALAAFNMRERCRVSGNDPSCLVPEPAGMTLLLSGLLGVAGLRRR